MSGLTMSRAVLGIRAVRGFTPEYVTHQLVADLFPDRPDRGYLYRTTRERPGGVEVLVLSDGSPRAPHEIPIHPYGATVHVESKPFAPRLRPGMELDFEVLLNATTETAGADGRKRRTDVWDAVLAADRNDARSPHDVYGAYLRRKLDGTAEVLDARITARNQVRARRGDRKEAIIFIAANVIGTLRVTDPDRLMEAVGAGIGRAKAFGCGLLCLSRPGLVLRRRTPWVPGEGE